MVIGSSNVYYLTGIFTVIVAVLLAFGLKDVYKENQKLKVLKSEAIVEEEKPTSKELFMAFLSHVWKEKSCIVVYLSGFAAGMGLKCCIQYGHIVFSEIYVRADKDYVSNHVSEYLFIAQMSQFVISPALGFLADRVKVWKLLFSIHVVLATGVTLFILNIPSENHIYTKE